LDVAVLGLVVEPLIMVVDRDREHLFRVVLADDVVIEDLADLLRSRDAFARLHQRRLVLFADDVRAQLDAFITDEHGRSGNELADLVLALTTERAIERVLGIPAYFAHPCSPPTTPAFGLLIPAPLTIRSATLEFIPFPDLSATSVNQNIGTG